MKIYVVNLRAFKKVIEQILLIIISAAITASALMIFDAFYVKTSATPASRSKVIIIDAGHGGEDPGAISADGIYEKDLNLEISMSLKSILEEKGYTVVMTRTEDKMLYSEDQNIKGMRKISDLKNRCKVAAEYPEALFISVHMNSFGASKYSGLQVYHSHENHGSRALAVSIQNNVKEHLQSDNKRTVKDGENIYILENCPATAVLIECGFLSNSAECSKLSEKEYQKELSFAIVCGIIEYIDNGNA